MHYSGFNTKVRKWNVMFRGYLKIIGTIIKTIFQLSMVLQRFLVLSEFSLAYFITHILRS